MADTKNKNKKPDEAVRANKKITRRRPLVERIAAALKNNRSARRIEEYRHLLGPGLTAGDAYDDPSGVEIDTASCLREAPEKTK
jgi:hypothetical protein